MSSAAAGRCTLAQHAPRRLRASRPRRASPVCAAAAAPKVPTVRCLRREQSGDAAARV
jgi:hypothetical protein